MKLYTTHINEPVISEITSEAQCMNVERLLNEVFEKVVWNGK